MEMAVRLAILALGVTLTACEPEPILGPPTESTCPQTSTLTYDNFGKSFMTKYCTRCHSIELTGAARMGATSFHDFDTVENVRLFAEHIDETSAAGPAATNKSMPPDSPSPTLQERKQLGEWIACGAP
jgi:uncharacterized membrane protein